MFGGWLQVSQDARAEVPAADALTEGGDFPSEQRCTYLELVVALDSGHSSFSLHCIEDVFYGWVPGDSGCTGRGACG